MADGSRHCARLNNQGSRASVAGDKSRDLQANGGGVGCAVTGLGERVEWGGQNKKYPKGMDHPNSALEAGPVELH